MKDNRGKEIGQAQRVPSQSGLGKGRGLSGGFVVGILLSAAVLRPTQVWAAPQVSEEYQIKAAFIYNFIKFVEWPQGRLPSESEPIVVGLVGKDPFGEVLDQVAQKPVKDRRIVIKRFPSVSSEDADPIHPQLDAIRQCHVLFICSSEKKAASRLLSAMANSAILTIGDAPGFLEDGGMINFLVEDRKVRFEIGLAKARTAKLDISSQLLRLAKRVIEDK